jgi:hypothetical protein
MPPAPGDGYRLGMSEFTSSGGFGNWARGGAGRGALVILDACCTNTVLARRPRSRR